MKKVELNIERQLKRDELRLINFASEEIISFSYDVNSLILFLEDTANEKLVIANIQKMLAKFIEHENNSEPIFSLKVKDRRYFADEDILRSNLIQEMEDGMIILKNEAVKLFDFFDGLFCELIKDFDVEYRKMPVLLPIRTYLDSKYLKSSPQYSIFCSFLSESLDSYNDLPKRIKSNSLNKVMKSPRYSLSPSACFHLYEELRNQEIKENKLYSFKQNVFRNEGRLNWNEKTRFLDYSVREIVFVGDIQYVVSVRNKIIERVEKMLEILQMNSQILVGADPFVIPEMQLYKKIQIKNKVKYELRINNSENKSTACASFNLHGTIFSSSFNFRVKGCDSTVSGCIGFGIERWVYTFLNQFGTNMDEWPTIVKEYFKSM